MRIVAFALVFLAWTPLAFAHAGSLKVAGDKDVVLYQTPISPLTGESVHLTFVVTKHDGNTQLPGIPVSFRLIESAYGDESKDRVLEEKSFTTDVNGAFEFSHRFDGTGYFDTELTFPGKQPETVGFLLQVRDRGASRFVEVGIGVTGLAAGMFLAAMFLKNRRKISA